MFKIYDGRSHFYQWDIDRKLIVEDASISEVHFCNQTDNYSLVCKTYIEDGLNLVNVPNILLQNDWRINVYAYDSNYTKFSEQFDVIRRCKPEDYVYTETEILNYNTLSDRITKIEEGGGITPTIGDNGNWFLGATDTGKPSRGEKGDTGPRGEKGDTGATGATGADGKSAYSYAQDGGHTRTEEEFAAKLAAEKLPNPYPLTFTGAVNETYDGSSAKTIEIPSGGGGGSGMNLSLVYENTFESVASINETIEALNGKENFVFNIEFTIPSDSTTAATINNSGLYNGERHFPIAYYVGYGNYSTSYPKKAAYGSFLKLGEGLWERIRLKAVSVEMFCNQNNLVAGNSIAFQYLKDNQNSHAAGLYIGFNQTMESVKIQIYAG